MKHIELYLWKEWRDQRTGIFGLILVVPILFVLAVLAWDSNRVATVLDPGLAAAIGALTALLVFGADLIPGEVRRARVAFLERLPAGLERAFTAKLVFFVAVTLFAAIYAMSVAVGLHALQGTSSAVPFLDAIRGQFVLPAIACALWIFAVSAWVPHGALAFPAAAIVIALLCSPAWFFFGPDSILQPTSGELRAFCALSAIGATVSAWFSFVRGYRFGRAPAHAALLGAVVAVLSLLPAWSWCAWRWHAAHTLDPHSDRFEISSAWLSEDGSRIFLNATNYAQNTPPDKVIWRGVRVDLKSGAWQSAASRVLVAEYAPGSASPARRVRSMILNGLENRIGDAHDEMVHSIKGSTGLVQDRNLPTASELGLDEHFRIQYWLGMGLMVNEVGKLNNSIFFDPFRKRTFDSAEIYASSPNLDRLSTCIRPGSWLVPRGLHRPREYELFDPDTRASTPATGWNAKDFLGPVLGDGRFLVVDSDGICIYTPETGARDRLTVRGELPGPVKYVWASPWTNAPLSRFQPQFLSLDGHEFETLARLDVEHNEIVTAHAARGRVRLVAYEDANTVLALEDQRTIVRLRFGTTDREVVFPRD